MDQTPSISTELPAETENPTPPVEKKKESKTALIIVGVVILLLLISSLVFMLASTSEVTGKIRDVFIIFLALQTLTIGVVLVILVVQISILVNLLQNEIKPIIKNTNETVTTLKGTATFLSDNLAKPVVRANTFFARIKRFFELILPKWW